MSDWEIRCGHVLDVLRAMPAESVQVCVTSPPYFGLRAYKTEPQVWDDGWTGELGSEPTIECYVEHIVAVFREVRRVLRDDATCWINVGDGYQNKQLVMAPARLALALQADGWVLRSDIAWCKKAPMPESVTDRPTSAWEHVFLLSKSARYYYDADAVREAGIEPEGEMRLGNPVPKHMLGANEGNDHRTIVGFNSRDVFSTGTRNAWNYWVLGPEPFPLAHFAVYPTEIPRRPILAGSSERGCCLSCGAPWRRVTSERYVKSLVHGEGSQMRKRVEDTDTNGWAGAPRVALEVETIGWEPGCACGLERVPCVVLDPFSGSGTTGVVALRHGRRYIGIELNAEYVAMSERRIRDDAPLWNAPRAEAPTTNGTHVEQSSLL